MEIQKLEQAAEKVNAYFTGDKKSGVLANDANGRQKEAVDALTFAAIQTIRARQLQKKLEAQSVVFAGKPEALVTFKDTCERMFAGAKKEEIFKLAGINLQKDSLRDMAIKLGMDKGKQFSRAGLEKLLEEHGTTAYFSDQPHNTGQFAPFRFFIPEFFTEIVEEAYYRRASWPLWVGANTVTSTYDNNKVPVVEQGDARMKELEEGEEMSLGVVKIGQRDVTMKTLGVGFYISDQVLNSTPFALLAQALQMADSAAAVGEDLRAVNVLVNGADAGLGAAVVGVANTTPGFQIEDLDYVMLNQRSGLVRPDCLLGRNEDLIKDLNSALPDRERKTYMDYFEEKVARVGATAYVEEFPSADIPSGKLLHWNKEQGIGRLQFGQFMVEQERKPRSLSNAIYMSFMSGFYTLKSNARFLLDKDVARVLNGANDFPGSYKLANFLANNAFEEY